MLFLAVFVLEVFSGHKHILIVLNNKVVKQAVGSHSNSIIASPIHQRSTLMTPPCDTTYAPIISNIPSYDV